MTTSPDTDARPQLSRLAASITVVVVLFGSFMDLLDATIVSVAAPTIQADLGADNAQLQWMIAAYTLALGAGLITGGRIGDDFGRRRAFLIGLAAFIVASALCAMAPTSEILIATRVVQGLAAGLMVPQVFGIIRSSLPPAVMGAAFGAYGAVQGLAAVAGPLLGGLLVELNVAGLEWRAIFWVNVPIGILGLALGLRFLPESRAPQKASFDVVGAILAAATAVAILLPLIQGREAGWPTWCFLVLVSAVFFAAAFFVWERRVARGGGQPILNPELLRNRGFGSGLIVSVLFFGGIGSFFFLLSLYLQVGTGRTALETGIIAVPYAVGSLITSGFGIRFATQHGRLILIIGALLIAASQAWLFFVVSASENPEFWAIAWPLFVNGLGLGLAAPPLVSVILAGVPRREAGSAGGVLTTVNQIGNSVGIAVLGTVFFAAAGSSIDEAASFREAFPTVLVWQVVLYVVAALFMLRLPARTVTVD